MNTVQWVMLAAPMVPAYAFFVWRGESNGRTNPVANLFTGLIVVPLVLGFLPAILLGVNANAWKKRSWGVAAGTFIALLLIAAYGTTIYHLRDRPPPSPVDLPVER